MDQSSNGQVAESSLDGVIELGLGREEFTVWSLGPQQGPTSEAIQDMLTVYKVLGGEKFQHMVQAEFGSGDSSPPPSTPA
jgi:hypothetical protein